MMRKSMSKQSSFPEIVQQFFTEYLVAQRALSPQTIACYRDALKLFLEFATSQLHRQTSSHEVGRHHAKSHLEVFG
ncbi:site-specific integrase [Providencia hangzhouensis]|uniref:site-specific integrase n=1 Tax=Providencia hangzhouensis TaxID=3031799 RepID=UPI0034DD959C